MFREIYANWNFMLIQDLHIWEYAGKIFFRKSYKQ